MGNNWKLHFKTADGSPACGQRLQVNLSLTNNPAAVTCACCMPFTRKVETVVLQVEMTDAEALAYAQFLKRVSWREYRDNAESDAEAYLMRDAGDKIRTALANIGYAPR